MVIVLCMLAFVFQGSRGIWQPDEGYYVGTAITMLQKQTLLIPYLGEDEIFLDKPPMIYWGILAGLKLFGQSEFAVRFFHAICFILTSLTVGLISWELFKDKILALLSTFIYATMAVPFIAANFVTPDTPLALFTTIAILFFWKSAETNSKDISWKMLLCLAVGFGYLAKGPAVLIPCGGMFIFLAVRRKVIKYFWTPWSIVGLLLFIAVGLGWYIWISIELSGAFTYLFDSQIWGRLVSEKYNRNPGLLGALIYLPVLIFGSLPWSSIWLEKRAVIRNTLFKKSRWRNIKDKPAVLFLICWFFIPLLILCLASSKLGFYVLPIFPALAIATAKLWKEKIPNVTYLPLKEKMKSFRKPVLLCSIWIIMLIFSKLILAYHPTPDDMRVLWAQIKPHLPNANYEVATVDDRADGLVFYGVKKIEHISSDSEAYPTFTKIEFILEEIKEMAEEKEQGIFLLHGDKDILKTINILREAGIVFETIKLPYDRTVLIMELPDGQGDISLS